MANQINQINHTLPIVDIKTGYVTDQFRVFINQVVERGLIIGQGSPDGVIQARQGVEYLNETGLAGSVKWIKQLSHIGGDKSLGWIAIG